MYIRDRGERGREKLIIVNYLPLRMRERWEREGGRKRKGEGRGNEWGVRRVRVRGAEGKREG